MKTKTPEQIWDEILKGPENNIKDRVIAAIRQDRASRPKCEHDKGDYWSKNKDSKKYVINSYENLLKEEPYLTCPFCPSQRMRAMEKEREKWERINVQAGLVMVHIKEIHQSNLQRIGAGAFEELSARLKEIGNISTNVLAELDGLNKDSLPG